ncbi:MAG: hypothetical protein BWX47_00550 [candidate division Hyd24-12 bacterium ADurb.Bin004]|nr:MAG: hypothetical protein BWX47_00550 [candidate division Hyd24-12 bacterium ADurb.Bin004]
MPRLAPSQSPFSTLSTEETFSEYPAVPLTHGAGHLEIWPRRQLLPGAPDGRGVRHLRRGKAS